MSSINLTLVRGHTKGYPPVKDLGDEELTKCFSDGGFQHGCVHLYMRPHLDKGNKVDGIFVRTFTFGIRSFWIKPGVLPLKDNYLHFSRLGLKNRIAPSDFRLSKGRGYLVTFEDVNSSKERREFFLAFFAKCHDLLEEPVARYFFPNPPQLHLDNHSLQIDKLETISNLCWLPLSSSK
ncbi:MAG: hypothetical protein K1060chlam2_01560 [Chlamydiae bacterium]|nr:hypothetical protein [Chlamydiota bacterium]